MTILVDSIRSSRSEHRKQLLLWLRLVLVLVFLAVPMPAIAAVYGIHAASFIFEEDKGDPYRTFTVKFKYRLIGNPSEQYKYMVFELHRVMENQKDLHPRLFVIPLKYGHVDALAKFRLPESGTLYNLSYYVVPFLRSWPLSVSRDTGGYISGDEERDIRTFYVANYAGTINIAEIRSSVATLGGNDLPLAWKPAPAPPLVAAPPPPVAAPPPSTPTVPYYWNSWFQKDGPKIVDELVVDEFITYTLVIDLSAYNYEDIFKYTSIGFGSVGGDKGFNKLLDNLIDRKITSVKFIVRPIVIGDNIKFDSEENISKKFEINLGKLRDPPKVPDLLGTDNLLNKNKEAYFQFAKQVQAGEMQFKIKAISPGCGAIALSIWNEDGDVPLDHLIRIVKVRSKDKNELERNCDDDGPPLRGGLKTLLSTALSGGAKRQIQADAALHVFETKSKGQVKSVVVFVDRSKIQDKSKNLGSPDNSVFSWETVSSISNYLMEKEHLYVKLKAAHAQGEKYITVAEELKEKIFTPKKMGDYKKAKDAFNSFLEIVNNSDHEPILLARLVSAENNILFMPLGLLSAGGDKSLLKKPITIVQPLYRDNFPHDNTCIGSWAFGIPHKMMDVKTGDLKVIDNILDNNSLDNNSKRINDLTELRSYLTNRVTLKKGEKGSGFILLAHHEGGNLWFDEKDDRLIIENVNRDYPPGSIAILSACSIGDTRGYDPPLVEVLNASGVDAMIISPFPVPAEYGTQLAINFTDIIVQENKKGNTHTLAELFGMATKQTEKYFKGTKNDLALEFTIVGDHLLRTCPKSIP